MSSSCRLRARRGLTLALVVATTGELAACSVGAQDAPVPVVAPRASTSAPTHQAGVPLTVQVYVVQGDRLFRLTRTVPPGAGAEPALAALAMPLTRAEVARGLRSALPTTGTQLKGELADGVARISVPSGFDRISVREQELAMAQLVFTITADTLASSVLMVHGSRPLAMPDDTGTLVDRPVTRFDYGAFQPAS